MEVLVLVLFAYLMGSIPYSIIFTWIFTGGKVNLLKAGTGNAGTENAWMMAGWHVGLLTGIMDLSKGIFAMLAATWWFGWNMTDNTMAMMFLTIPAWIGHCFPFWMKFKGGFGNGIIMGTRLHLGGPVIWIIAQIFLLPNLFIKNKHYKVAFNHAMALGVNIIGALIFLMLHYVDMGYFQWGLFHVIGQPIGDYLAVFQVSMIWVGLYMARRLMFNSFIKDLKAGVPFWRSVWPRIFFEGFPDETNHTFPDEDFKLVLSMFWGRRAADSTA